MIARRAQEEVEQGAAAQTAGRWCDRGGCTRLQAGVVLAEEETPVPWTTRGAGVVGREPSGTSGGEEGVGRASWRAPALGRGREEYGARGVKVARGWHWLTEGGAVGWRLPQTEEKAGDGGRGVARYRW